MSFTTTCSVCPTGGSMPLKVRSMVGLDSAVRGAKCWMPELLAKVPEFAERLEWFLKHRPDLAGLVSRWQRTGAG